VLVVMIFAQFNPERFNRKIWWLLFYAIFYVFAKYIYTLVPYFNQHDVWGQVIGFSSQSYAYQSTREFWRLRPPTPAWFFVFAVAV
jgi:5-methylcytosine-specific restriction endonuclease McrBC regulatory subunit McrC